MKIGNRLEYIPIQIDVSHQLETLMLFGMAIFILYSEHNYCVYGSFLHFILNIRVLWVVIFKLLKFILYSTFELEKLHSICLKWTHKKSVSIFWLLKNYKIKRISVLLYLASEYWLESIDHILFFFFWKYELHQFFQI